jgi:DNA-binding MarR family transcriptional regulator
MPTLDTTIHQPVRLQIMAALAALTAKERVNFAYLRDVLKTTDGNLGAHLLKLEEAGYLAQEKTFVNRKPRTDIWATDKGRAAFQDHVAALKQLLEPAQHPLTQDRQA